MWFIIRFANHARGWKIDNEKNCNTLRFAYGERVKSDCWKQRFLVKLFLKL